MKYEILGKEFDDWKINSGVKVMGAYSVQEQIMTNHIIDQLHELNYRDTDGKTRKELIYKLAILKEMQVDVEHPESKWF